MSGHWTGPLCLRLLGGQLTELENVWRSRLLNGVTWDRVGSPGGAKERQGWADEVHEDVKMEKSPLLAPLSLLLVVQDPRPHSDSRIKSVQFADSMLLLWQVVLEKGAVNYTRGRESVPPQVPRLFPLVHLR